MAREVCPTCLRPVRSLAAHERARRGASATERQAAGAMSPGELATACRLVLDALRRELYYADTFGSSDGFVSARRLRNALGGGDGPRRARQLRDEYGYRISVEMRPGPPREAHYRLEEDPHPIPDSARAEMFPELDR